MKILKNNDRTWCFWKTTIHFGDNLFQKMGSALFANENFRRDLDLQPYHYNMVKGLDFTGI
jgi:lycopene beta-cyclase